MPSHQPYARRIAGVAACVAVALIGELSGSVPASAAPPAVQLSTASMAAPTDYFTNQWNDPLDFSNPEDISLTRLHINQGAASMTGGRLAVEGVSQIILSRGDPGAIPTSAVRDPRTRELNGNAFNRLTFRMHSDRAAAGAVGFRTCDSCNDGYRYFEIVSGWHTYDFDMTGTNDVEGWPGGTSRFAGPSWGGSIGLLYLSIAFNTPTKPSVIVDDASVYASNTSMNVNIGTGSGSVELWQDTNANTGDDGNTASGAGESANRVGSFAAGSSVTINSGLLRPDTPTRFYTVQNGVRSAASSPLTMASTSTPIPAISSPSELGGADFATTVRGDPWDFSQPSDVKKTFNVSASVRDGALFGFAAGARNDPVVLFELGPRQIDATLFHKVVVTMNFDGPFGLEDAPGGGLVGRFVWRGSNGAHEQVSYPIVVKPGRATYVVSFRTTPATAILDPTGNSEWIGWGTGITNFVSMLRFDPHEDPGDRSWQIDNVQLLRDEAVSPTFGIQFRDDAWAPGTTARLYADTNRQAADGLGAPISGDLAVTPGTNTFEWNGAGVGAGPYWIHTVMTRGGRGVTASSTGQVAVGMNGAGEPPATVEPARPGTTNPQPPTSEQIQAFFRFLLRAKFFCAVARQRGDRVGGGASICNLLLGPMPPPRRSARRRARR